MDVRMNDRVTIILRGNMRASSCVSASVEESDNVHVAFKATIALSMLVFQYTCPRLVFYSLLQRGRPLLTCTVEDNN